MTEAFYSINITTFVHAQKLLAVTLEAVRRKPLLIEPGYHT